MVRNSGVRFRGTAYRFKLWPSRIDRPAFEHVMDNTKSVPPHLSESRIHQAHTFFRSTIESWSDQVVPQERSRRLQALTIALIQRLQIVEISLSDEDDDQVIFETLNDRGTPLLAADLIKNYIFQKGDELRADVERWADDWEEFDDDWWRTEVAQGRSLRSRIDLFLQYWLTMREQDEIPVDAVFKRFRGHAGASLTTLPTADRFLARMLRDAATFREFAQMDSTTVAGRYYARVVESLELGATIPVLLWILSDNHEIPDDQIELALASIESWVIRRTLLRQTLSNVNRIVVQLLRELDANQKDRAGEVTRDFLASQSADTSAWPTDEQVRAALPRTRLYGSLKQQRLRMVLECLEIAKRTARNEDVTINGKLEIEHVMPGAWRVHWMSSAMRDAKLAEERDLLINTLGNLTLVTNRLNKELSHRPWTDAQASELPPVGTRQGLGKRSLIAQSLLALNHDLVRKPDWNEDEIRARSEELCELAIRAWPRPAAASAWLT